MDHDTGLARRYQRDCSKYHWDHDYPKFSAWYSNMVWANYEINKPFQLKNCKLNGNWVEEIDGKKDRQEVFGMVMLAIEKYLGSVP